MGYPPGVAPEVAPELVAAALGERYGFALAGLEPAARGWTGETYTATTVDGARFFVKVFPSSRLPRTAAPALPALAELPRLGIREVPRVVPGQHGALGVWIGAHLVVVFDHLDARRVEPFPFGGEGIGDLVGRVHAATARVTAPPARETFEPPYAEELWQDVARLRAQATDEAPRAVLRSFVERRREELDRDWAAFGEVARACRAAGLELVLTHGDWPFNVLEDRGKRRYLVDWDEMLLAPAERDTWFAGDDPPFWRGYRPRRPDHAASHLATAFYLYNRFFEELRGTARVILADTPPDERAWAVKFVDSAWTMGLRTRMHSAWALARGVPPGARGGVT